MATMALIMGFFLTFLVGASIFCVVFLMIDMIFSHRITESLRVWYERKFRTE